MLVRVGEDHFYKELLKRRYFSSSNQALSHHGKRNDMKIYEVERNPHNLCDKEYSAKDGKRFFFATKELAVVFVIRDLSIFLAIVTTRYHLKWYSMASMIHHGSAYVSI